MLADGGGVHRTGTTPHEQRRGWLKNNNPPGDFSKAARCRAKNRRGMPCQCPAMPNGRCRLHGGLSTGPKTEAGIERIRQAVTKHGRYSKRARAERKHYRKLLLQCRETMAAVLHGKICYPLRTVEKTVATTWKWISTERPHDAEELQAAAAAAPAPSARSGNCG